MIVLGENKDDRMTIVEHDPLEQLESRFAGEREARVAKRMLIVIKARRGETAKQIARRVCLTDRMVQKGIERDNAEELAGLVDRPGRGRRYPLADDEEQRFRDRLERGPTTMDGVCVFRGEDARRVLQAEFGKRMSLSAVYNLLHRLGSSSLIPRPKHRRADPAAQVEFKKLPTRVSEIQAAHGHGQRRRCGGAEASLADAIALRPLPRREVDER